jgi:hypothetical protein
MHFVSWDGFAGTNTPANRNTIEGITPCIFWQRRAGQNEPNPVPEYEA